ncbi:MAG: GerMN domain-containing protein [Bacillota bacterium]
MKRLVLWIFLFSLVVLTTGCSLMAALKPAPVEPPPASQPPPTQPTAPQVKEQVTLYFAGPDADKVMPEVREVVVEGTLAETIVNELINGPTVAGLGRTIPAEARLLELTIEDKVAYVNFSRELQTKHWGGSTGDIMTIYSVVTSLTAWEDIESVQFLLEGKKEEAIFGHLATDRPIKPDPSYAGN